MDGRMSSLKEYKILGLAKIVLNANEFKVLTRLSNIEEAKLSDVVDDMLKVFSAKKLRKYLLIDDIVKQLRKTQFLVERTAETDIAADSSYSSVEQLAWLDSEVCKSGLSDFARAAIFSCLKDNVVN